MCTLTVDSSWHGLFRSLVCTCTLLRYWDFCIPSKFRAIFKEIRIEQFRANNVFIHIIRGSREGQHLKVGERTPNCCRNSSLYAYIITFGKPNSWFVYSRKSICDTYANRRILLIADHLIYPTDFWQGTAFRTDITLYRCTCIPVHFHAQSSGNPMQFYMLWRSCFTEVETHAYLSTKPVYYMLVLYHPGSAAPRLTRNGIGGCENSRVRTTAISRDHSIIIDVCFSFDFAKSYSVI